MSHMLNNYMSNDILSTKGSGGGSSDVDIVGLHIYVILHHISAKQQICWLSLVTKKSMTLNLLGISPVQDQILCSFIIYKKKKISPASFRVTEILPSYGWFVGYFIVFSWFGCQKQQKNRTKTIRNIQNISELLYLANASVTFFSFAYANSLTS